MPERDAPPGLRGCDGRTPATGRRRGLEGPFQVGCAPGASAEGLSLGDAAVGKGEMSVATT